MRNVHVLLAAAILVSGCSDDPVENETIRTETETHQIRDVDYVKNTYFYVDEPAHFVGAKVADFEVFRQVLPPDLAIDPTIARLPAWAVVDSLGTGVSIVDAAAAIDAGSRPRLALAAEFRRLEPDVDFRTIVDSTRAVIIGIELTEPIPPDALRVLAMRYVNTLDAPVGGSYATFGVTDPGTGQPVIPGSAADTLMLEMIKPPDPSPTGWFGATWRLAVRNVYNVGFTDIDGSTFRVVIEDILTMRSTPHIPEGSTIPYLRIFGLDQTGATGSGPPDGTVDLARFVDLERGRLFLPAVRAFAPPPDSVAGWTGGAFAFTGPYEAQYRESERIYDEHLNASTEWFVHQYVIEASVTRPVSR